MTAKFGMKNNNNKIQQIIEYNGPHGAIEIPIGGQFLFLLMLGSKIYLQRQAKV